MRKYFDRSSPGYTFVELIIVTAVMMILASAMLPIVRVSVRRQKEMELHRTLREVRAAIDKYKDYADTGAIAATELQFGADNYPPSLETLVEGVTRANDASGKNIKFLRRIPIDPLTGSTDWGMRSYSDAPDSTVWGGMSVYDIYSKAQGKGLDGTKYRDW